MRATRFKQVDMTQGRVLHSIVSFSLPLLIGSLFQTLYNASYPLSWVAGCALTVLYFLSGRWKRHVLPGISSGMESPKASCA